MARPAHGVGVDQLALLVGDPQLAATLALDDVPATADRPGLRGRVGAGSLVPLLTTSQPPRSEFGTT